MPAHGVYATKVYFPNGSRMAVTSIGTRPTVDSHGEVNVEGYILDFSGDLYGQTIRMEFYHFKSEVRFPVAGGPPRRHSKGRGHHSALFWKSGIKGTAAFLQPFLFYFFA